MRLKKIFCRHKWEKFMGCRNVGGGKFSQQYKCSKCGKSKIVVK